MIGRVLKEGEDIFAEPEEGPKEEAPEEEVPEEMLEEKKKKRRRYILILFILLFLFAILLFVYIAPEFKELDMSLRVADKIGIDVSYTEITFGTIPPSGTATREVVVSNLNDYDKLVQFSIEGTIRDFVDTPADRLLKANENISVNVVASLPPDAEFGNYTGKFKIFLRRAI